MLSSREAVLPLLYCVKEDGPPWRTSAHGMFLPAQMCKRSAQRLIECWLMPIGPVGADRVARRQPANEASHRPLYLHAQARSHKDVGSLPRAAHAFRR